MTLKEWDDEADTLTKEELFANRKALQTLVEWKAFNDAFRWTGIFTLIQILQYSLERKDR